MIQDVYGTCSKVKEAEGSFNRRVPQSQCLVRIIAVCSIGIELDGTRGAAPGGKPATDAKWTQGC